MAQYSPKRFFRQVPNRWLQRYFAERQVLMTVDFEALSETQIEPIYAAWLELPEVTRNRMERDFQDIDDLASEGGSKAILDEAAWHGEDLTEQFASLNGFHEHAFWTFLERPKCWRGALAFERVDRVPGSYWRKRKNLPRTSVDVSLETIQLLEQKLGHYFHTEQGRGKNCKVDCYKRNDLDYFFAFPEDYARASIEWEDREFKRRPHHPAFEVIFVYKQSEGTLDLFLSGERKSVPDLQAIFAETILKAELGLDVKEERVYNLTPLTSRQFQFSFDASSGITDVAVKKLRFKVWGKDETILLTAESKQNKHAVFDLLDKVKSVIPLDQLALNLIGIKVTFAPSTASNKPSTRSFDIGWPNSCSLKHDERDLIIRKLLADSGIEPREPASDASMAK